MDEWQGLGLGGYYYVGDPRVRELLTLACGGGGDCDRTEEGNRNSSGQGLAPGQEIESQQELVPTVPPVSITETLQTLSLSLSQSSNYIQTICCASIPS